MDGLTATDRIRTMATEIFGNHSIPEDQLIAFYKRAINDAADCCADLADLTKPCPTGDEFKHVYLFAMDRILELP